MIFHLSKSQQEDFSVCSVYFLLSRNKRGERELIYRMMFVCFHLFLLSRVISVWNCSARRLSNVIRKCLQHFFLAFSEIACSDTI